MDIVSLLSILTTSLCLFLKLPQILSVIRSDSVRGLSRSSLMLEFWSYCTTTSYSMCMGYHWKMFCEYPPLIVQDLILFLLMMRKERELMHASRNSSLRTFIAVTIAVHSLIACRFFSKTVPLIAISISSPIGIVSKILQLMAIVRNKSAGSVSPTTWFLNFISTLSRLVSYLITISDWALIFSLSASAILNLCISLACFMYPTVPTATLTNGIVTQEKTERKKEL